MNRNRISLVKEDRIWSLRTEGYCYDAIARIVNTSPGALTEVIRRVRNRPPMEVDPVRRGRRAGWLSDAQVEDIKARRARGETLFSIGKSYYLDGSTIGLICRGKTYKDPETTYPWSFDNRLHAA